MDDLVVSLLASKSGTPELKAEYVRLANICRHISVCDVDLAWEVLSTAMTFGFQFAWLVLEEIKLLQSGPGKL